MRLRHTIGAREKSQRYSGWEREDPGRRGVYSGGTRRVKEVCDGSTYAGGWWKHTGLSFMSI